MKEDKFIVDLLTDFYNGSLFMENSTSEKKEDQDQDQKHEDEDEDEDSQIYIHEEIKWDSEEECDDDTVEEDRAFLKDPEKVVENGDEEEEEEEKVDAWMLSDETDMGLEPQKQKKNIRVYFENDKEEDEEDEEEEDIIIQPSNKRPRIDNNLDRISDLTNDTLLHIMSFLPMKDNVKIGILSKRWENLWTESTTLVFKNKSYNKGENLNFLDFVNYALQSSACRNIKKFVLDFVYLSLHSVWVDCAIRFLTRRKADDVLLRFRKGFKEEDKYQLPQYLFSSKSFKFLSLFNCVVAPIGDIRWKSLKSLSLECIELSDNLASKILKGCLNLEVLKISSCNGVGLLDIHSEKLKELVVTHSFDTMVDWSDETVLVISAPHLKLLSLLGNFYKRRCRLANVASLVKVDLGLKCDNSRDYEENRSYMFFLLEKLEHVEEIKLGTWCTQVLSTEQINQFDYIALKWRTLTLQTNFMDLYCNLNLEILLNSSPFLETLKVDMAFQSNFKNCEICENRDVAVSLSHLKTVEIINFNPSHQEFVLRIVEIILEKANELEKMVIRTGNSGYYEWSSCLGSQRFIQLTRKIMRYPRCSPKAVILI